MGWDFGTNTLSNHYRTVSIRSYPEDATRISSKLTDCHMIQVTKRCKELKVQRDEAIHSYVKEAAMELYNGALALDVSGWLEVQGKIVAKIPVGRMFYNSTL